MGRSRIDIVPKDPRSQKKKKRKCCDSKRQNLLDTVHSSSSRCTSSLSRTFWLFPRALHHGRVLLRWDWADQELQRRSTGETQDEIGVIPVVTKGLLHKGLSWSTLKGNFFFRHCWVTCLEVESGLVDKNSLETSSETILSDCDLCINNQTSAFKFSWASAPIYRAAFLCRLFLPFWWWNHWHKGIMNGSLSLSLCSVPHHSNSRTNNELNFRKRVWSVSAHTLGPPSYSAVSDS